MTITFTIPGRVSGKGRPKFRRIGNFVQTYTPEKTANMEAVVRAMASEAMRGSVPFAGAVWLHIQIRLMPPKSWSKKKQREAFFATGKPDLDNVLKLLGDALNGICWADDAQISALFCARTYDADRPESVTVTIGTLENRQIDIERPDWAPPEMPLFGGAAAP